MTDFITENNDLLEKFKNYFADVSTRAKQRNTTGLIQDKEIIEIIKDDLRLHYNSPRLAAATSALKLVAPSSQPQETEMAKKQVELTLSLRALLGFIAGLTPTLVSEIITQQLNSPRTGDDNLLATHPTLEQYLDQAPSSFLDAYKAMSEVENNKDDTKKDTLNNELTNKLKNVLRFTPPAPKPQAPEPEAPAPRITSTPTPRPMGG